MSQQLNEIIHEEKDAFVEESKGFVKDYLNGIFGDFNRFLSIFNTTLYWFLNPLKIYYREHISNTSKYLSDYSLIKSLFLLMILFIVVSPESTASQNSEGSDLDDKANQFVYLLSYVISIAVYLGIGHLWALISKSQHKNKRLFHSYLLYEFATIFFIQGVAAGICGITLFDGDDFSILGVLFLFLVPSLHSVYFYFRLGKEFKSERNTLGVFFAFLLMGSCVLIPALFNEVMLVDGF